MRILLVYPNNTGYSRVPIGLALIYTCLLEAGHDVKIYDTTFYNIFKQTDDDIREKLCEDLGFIKNVDVIREGLRGEPVLNMPQISKKQLKGIQKTFPFYCELPIWSFFLIRVAEGNSFISKVFYAVLALWFKKIRAISST